MTADTYGLPDLPENWSWGTLQNCTDILDSRRIPVNSKERNARIEGKPETELFPYYGATGQVGWIDDYLFDEELVLLGEDGAPFLDSFREKAYIVRGKSWVNNHAHVLRALKGLMLNSFLCHYLNIVDYRNYVTGTTRLKLNQSRMKKIPVPIPPINEQKKIVAAIEELFTRLDAGLGSLRNVKAQFQLYRQAVLKHAFNGKLTEEWRKTHKDQIEPTSVLLERIKKGRKYERLLPLDTSELPELPEEWEWTRTGEICEGIVPGRTKPKEFKGQIPWVTLPDVKGLYISKSQDNLAVTKEDAEKVGMKVMPKGTVLISCVGQFGIVCIASCPIVPNQQFHGFVCLNNILPEYVAFSLMTQLEQMKKLSTATTIAYMNKTKCNSISIPLAPLTEQSMIVEEIERRFSLVDEAEKVVNKGLKQAEYLRQSILKIAFEGGLVPQDPSDEPAEKLLERKKQEKNNQKNETRSRRKTGKRSQRRLIAHVE